MASEDHPPSPAERKPRKSVAFTDEQLIVDADGSVKMVTAAEEAPKDSAQSHAARTPPLSAALGAFRTDPADEAATTDPAAADDTGLDLSLLKKKKKKSSKPKDEDGADEAAGDDGGLDLSMKKKKKKKAKDAAEDDDFAAKLKELEVKEEEEGTAGDAADGDAATAGDMEAGTGIWAHDETRSINYPMLLSRFFTLLQQKNPDHALSGTKTYKIPPPQCMREGNRKTVFANIAEICRRMKRSEEHLTSYLFAELGTIGSVDGSRRLVIKGRWTPAQLETVLRKYIIEYVTCKTCKSPDTELNKGENRLYFVTCNNCGSRRSVTAIKTGFSAQVGKRKKMQG
ncbi:eukaryotic translation initiation factor 2 beta subunit [Cordyceps fumosorosea ARSEF 2679]|uniref:Eukaryotic translation initiation factor 2 beta subunit n=1 Tax=Cordyceps fumosorosea (strain ARSEF 2679) TaxID=1081104 RepID=A0A167NEN0_CORFA|nr:eukaryotic translation initiation factor 2 beta subunit [Cordyceps fumosorosea ARSEF 2679]OAA55477.1 eukaryotic translation initiation factor 2 beta subunit [Cordyceps fumosorosea ARSEF 2679]